ncbi:MAG: hypothetical protein KC486_15755 [Myxococcales bacterium]|nr:hypothetical protein [Myxococcales bacterium]
MIGQHVYPGKTSTRRVGNSLLTFQTELRGDPPTVVTIVVLRGRTLRTFTQALAELEARRPGAPLVRLVDEAHERVVARLNLQVKGAARAAASDTATATLLDETADESASPGERASELVLLAVEAVDKLEYQGALDLLETALECAPGDPRLERSIARLRELV